MCVMENGASLFARNTARSRCSHLPSVRRPRYLAIDLMRSRDSVNVAELHIPVGSPLLRIGADEGAHHGDDVEDAADDTDGIGPKELECR